MADKAYVLTLLRGITDQRTRVALEQAFTHVMDNIRLGVPEHQTRAVNLQGYWLQSTTASDTSEFSIAHGLLTAPHYAIPVLELDKVGSKAGGLTVSRAADAARIYLKADAGSTNAPITVLVEA